MQSDSEHISFRREILTEKYTKYFTTRRQLDATNEK